MGGGKGQDKSILKIRSFLLQSQCASQSALILILPLTSPCIWPPSTSNSDFSCSLNISSQSKETIRWHKNEWDLFFFKSLINNSLWKSWNNCGQELSSHLQYSYEDKKRRKKSGPCNGYSWIPKEINNRHHLLSCSIATKRFICLTFWWPSSILTCSQGL